MAGLLQKILYKGAGYFLPAPFQALFLFNFRELFNDTHSIRFTCFFIETRLKDTIFAEADEENKRDRGAVGKPLGNAKRRRITERSEGKRNLANEALPVARAKF